MYITDYCLQGIKTIESLNVSAIDNAVLALSSLKQRRGRLFILGVGGSAANASHAVNDFRKIAHIDACTPVDNVSEMTARINDDGWEHVFVDSLRCSHFSGKDMLMIFSVGGGCQQQQLSVNLINALDLANELGANSIAVVGRAEGYCLKHATHPIQLPVFEKQMLTPISEAMQAFVWHALVSHPKLKTKQMTWEKVHESQQ